MMILRVASVLFFGFYFGFSATSVFMLNEVQSKHSNILISCASVISLLFVCFPAERYLLGHRLVQNVPSHGHLEARLWLPGQH